jgi:DNA-binding transcriptional LysR family regulator
MDRLDAMTAFALTVDAGSLSAAARKLGRSPASIMRAVASLEQHLGSV